MPWDENELPAIRTARLLLAPPHVVYDELRQYGAIPGRRYGVVDGADMEAQLLERGERLINLGLAQWGGARDVVMTLYKSATSANSLEEGYARAIRLAVASNRHAEGIMTFLFGVDETPLVVEVLQRDDEAELKALMSNPMHRGLLVKLFMGKAPFDGLDMRQRAFMVMYAAENSALNTDDSNVDGPDLTAWDIHKAVWGMLRVTPVDEYSARAMHEVLLRFDPRRARPAASLADIEATLARWSALKVGGFNDGEERDGDMTDLTYTQELCVLIAAHFGRAYDKELHHYGSATSEDIYKRAAHYGVATMTPEEMAAARAKDGQMFTLAALFNDSMFTDVRRRAELESGLGEFMHWQYARRCQQMAARYKGFKVAPVLEELQQQVEPEATPAVAEASQVSELAAQVAKLGRDMSTLKASVFWGVVIVGGLVIYFG